MVYNTVNKITTGCYTSYRCRYLCYMALYELPV